MQEELRAKFENCVATVTEEAMAIELYEQLSALSTVENVTDVLRVIERDDPVE